MTMIPVALRFPFVMAFAMALVLAVMAIVTASSGLGFNLFVPISLCFTTIAVLCGFIGQLVRRLDELERRLVELEVRGESALGAVEK